MGDIDMRRVDTHELLHVYSDHTANGIKRIKGEEDQYSRDELLSIISSAREEMEIFLDYWLKPAIAELDNQIECYKEAMLALVRGNSNWAMNLTDDQEKLIETMVRRAESV